jgi:hypothetical protein
MLLKTIRWGGCSSRAVAQLRLRVSKLGLNGLSDYHSNQTAVKAARLGPSGPKKRTTLTECLLKRQSWTIALSLIEQRAKGSPPEKNTTSKKNVLILAPGNVADMRS